MDRDNVRMRKAGSRPRLPKEPLSRLWHLREMRREHFDGDIPIERHIPSEVHHTHPTPAELALQRVLTGEGCLKVEELSGWVAHGAGFVMQSRLTRRDRATASDA